MRFSLPCRCSSIKTCMPWPVSSEANFALAQRPAKWHIPLLPKPEAPLSEFGYPLLAKNGLEK